MRKGVFLKQNKKIVNVGNSIKREENMKYVGDTLAIRQSYDSHTLLNRQTYAKMSMYVSDTSDIRYQYVTHALSIR